MSTTNADLSMSIGSDAGPAESLGGKTETTSKRTIYLVMFRSEAESWKDIGLFEAVNGRKAVELAMEFADLEQGDFRAIPERSADILSPRVAMRIEWT